MFLLLSDYVLLLSTFRAPGRRRRRSSTNTAAPIAAVLLVGLYLTSFAGIAFI
jgi:hypothetical protein